MGIGAAISQKSQSDGAIGALPSPVSASVAHLKVKGTAMVANLAASSSSIDTATRSCRSGRSAGQIYGHSPRMIDMSEPPPSADTSRFNASVDRGRESIQTLTRPGAPPGRTANPHIETYSTAITPKGKTRPRKCPEPHRPCKNRGLPARPGEATCCGHEHDQIDCRRSCRSPLLIGLLRAVRHFRRQG